MSEMDVQGDHHDFSDPERFVDPESHEITPGLRAMNVFHPGKLGTDEEAEAYDANDPKGPRFHSTHADLWDQREGK